MSNLHIYHNLGLGDHIIFNGLVRTIAQTQSVSVFCKNKNEKQVRRMYEDNPKINPVALPDNHSIDKYIHDNQIRVMRLKPKRQRISFDIITYRMAGVPIENKYSQFYIRRNYYRENWLYNELYKLDRDEDYVFVHDDIQRGYTIYRGLPKMKQVRPINEVSITIFDYLTIIEQAVQIHCIDSCFFNLIDCIGIKNPKLFLHKYVRFGVFTTPYHRSYWREIV